jgi:hypothetical protein
MTKVRIEPIGGKGNALDPAKFKRAIENAGNMTAKAVQVDFKVTTRTWKHQPDFTIEHTQGRPIWDISTGDVIYRYVSEGTKRHPISAKNAPFLAYFKTGFRPKSRPGFIGSNAGAQASKDFRGPKTVMHPGTEAREFAQAIAKKWKIEWPRQLQRAIRAVNTFGGK